MKKNRGDELIGVIAYIYMDISQGNSLCSYLNLKQATTVIFLFSFSSTKLENKRMQQVCGGRRAGTSGMGEVVGKGGRRVNTVQHLAFTYKNDTC
jgi:uncharacterized membrane protein YjfL (UPF0719 family)